MPNNLSPEDIATALKEKAGYKNKAWLKAKLDAKTPISLIAMECGVTKETIKRWFVRHKLERRTILERWLEGMYLGITCPRCGKTVPNANFCCDCGLPLTPINLVSTVPWKP